jgi:deazaflavin-dependent oxidoreductase (nitroreductase family)
MDSMTSLAQIPPSSGFARRMRAIGRATTPISRLIAGRRFFPLYAVVHHRGRRSGRAYAVPVAVRVTDEAFTIALPWGAETQWLRNVLAAGECTIRWSGRDHRTIEPAVIGFDEAVPAFSQVQRAILRAIGVRIFLRLRRVQATAAP